MQQSYVILTSPCTNVEFRKLLHLVLLGSDVDDLSELGDSDVEYSDDEFDDGMQYDMQYEDGDV